MSPSTVICSDRPSAFVRLTLTALFDLVQLPAFKPPGQCDLHSVVDTTPLEREETKEEKLHFHKAHFVRR